MNFINPSSSIAPQDIADAEAVLGVNLPPPVRELYLSENGGSPESYVFEDENIDTVVSEFLPLKSERRGSAMKSYERLVLDKKLAPRNFLPFAVDGGGDYFF